MLSTNFLKVRSALHSGVHLTRCYNGPEDDKWNNSSECESQYIFCFNPHEKVIPLKESLLRMIQQVKHHLILFRYRVLDAFTSEKAESYKLMRCKLVKRFFIEVNQNLDYGLIYKRILIPKQ